jgi:hypothetical protein
MGLNQYQGPRLGTWKINSTNISLKLPEEIAIVHVPGHQKEVNFETRGNSFADETTKQASLTSEAPVFCLIPHLPAPHITPIFTPSEEEQLKKKSWGSQD